METLWNVNEDYYLYNEGELLVLIETLWNVNDDPDWGEENSYKVLIETLWNVNKKRYNLRSYLYLSFNRNIVECK